MVKNEKTNQENICDKIFVSTRNFTFQFNDAEKIIKEKGQVEITARGRMISLAADLALLLERKKVAKIIDVDLFTDTHPINNKLVTRISIILLKNVGG